VAALAFAGAAFLFYALVQLSQSAFDLNQNAAVALDYYSFCILSIKAKRLTKQPGASANYDFARPEKPCNFYDPTESRGKT
tara:strand:- start:240315 stop:240557 length:243 start_codon:yes stop_codon:yes gene_type:complete